MEFKQEYFTEFRNPPWNKEVAALVENYYVRTEKYDRLICTGPMGKDGILPANGIELGLICQNAQKEWQNMLAEISLVIDKEDDAQRYINYYITYAPYYE